MKNIAIYIAAMLLFGCRYNLAKTNKSLTYTTIDSNSHANNGNTLNLSIDIKGIWALSNDTNENATIEFTRDSVIYLDAEYSPNPYKIDSSTLNIFMDEFIASQRVISYSKDSFCTLLNGDTIWYYRRSK